MVSVGDTYGRLRVESISPGKHDKMATCLCVCGNTTTIPASRLTFGQTKSCGCLRKEMLLNGAVRRKHGGKGTRLYGIWKGMRERCNTSTCGSYKEYGARGVRVCEEWNDFSAFKRWAMDNGYESHLTIDRIDPNGSYTPDNCRWATYTEQARNKRNSRYLTANGQTLPMATWAEKVGISTNTIFARLKRGWSEEAAVNTPLIVTRRML